MSPTEISSSNERVNIFKHITEENKAVLILSRFQYFIKFTSKIESNEQTGRHYSRTNSAYRANVGNRGEIIFGGGTDGQIAL